MVPLDFLRICLTWRNYITYYITYCITTTWHEACKTVYFKNLNIKVKPWVIRGLESHGSNLHGRPGCRGGHRKDPTRQPGFFLKMEVLEKEDVRMPKVSRYGRTWPDVLYELFTRKLTPYLAIPVLFFGLAISTGNLKTIGNIWPVLLASIICDVVWGIVMLIYKKFLALSNGIP